MVLDAHTVESALATAEALADTAEPAVGGGERPTALVDLLLNDARPEALLTALAAGDYPADAGLSLWIEDMSRVLTAWEAVRSAPGADASALRAELGSLPTVPLDAEGAAERERLAEALILAETPASERAIVSAQAARIEALMRQVRPGPAP